MAKLLIFFLLVALISLVGIWFVENDGSVIVEWMGYRVQTSMAFVSLACTIAIITCAMLLQFIMWVKGYPKRFKKANRERKRDRGLTALTEGFAAIAAGDTKQARLLTKKATYCLGPIPITHLLSAQTAQLEGNHEQVKLHYTALLENKDTEIIAIKGLLIQARQEGDLAKAQFLAEKALKLRPDADWVVSILTDLYKMTMNWDKAQLMLERAHSKKLITNDNLSRSMAVMSVAKSKQAQEQGKLPEAFKCAKRAYKLRSEFVPAVKQFASILIEMSEKKKAAKILEHCWVRSASSEIAELYMKIYELEPALKKLEKAERLLGIMPNHPDSHIIVAKTALAVGDTAKARGHIRMAIGMRETTSLCNMMAELERQEGASHDIVEQWQDRATTSSSDNAWVCASCNHAFVDWSANCPNCSSFDSLRWANPTLQKMNILLPSKELITAG